VQYEHLIINNKNNNNSNNSNNNNKNNQQFSIYNLQYNLQCQSGINHAMQNGLKMMPTLGLRLMDSPHMLNLMSTNFATSSAFFEANTDEDWTKTTVHDVFPYFESEDGMGRILRMCLASLVHHRDKVLAFEPNHIARTSISIFPDPLKKELSINSVKVIHAWDSNRHLTGIPAHVKELVDLHELKVEQSQLAQSIYEKVMDWRNTLMPGESEEEKLPKLVWWRG
jgi:hypothetical protein